MIISKKRYLELLKSWTELKVDNNELRLRNDMVSKSLYSMYEQNKKLEAENKRLSQVVEDTANMVKKIQEEL